MDLVVPADALQGGALGVLALVCVGGLKLAREVVAELRALRVAQERLASLIVATIDPRVAELARVLSMPPTPVVSIPPPSSKDP